MNSVIERALTAMEKIYQILDTPSFVADAPHAMEPPPSRAGVEFKDVQFFSYNAGRRVLKDINLQVGPPNMRVPSWALPARARPPSSTCCAASMTWTQGAID